jgi:alpha-tubulin suppressor-like RCC1 family protein
MYAFAALTQNGKVISWGDPRDGGDSSSVREDLQSDVIDVVANKFAFAALKSNGKVISWGHTAHNHIDVGGNSSHLPSLNSGVNKIEAIRNGRGFRATKHGGSVIEWP